MLKEIVVLGLKIMEVRYFIEYKICVRCSVDGKYCYFYRDFEV